MMTALRPAAGAAARALNGRGPLTVAKPRRPNVNATISRRVTAARRDRVAGPDARWAPVVDGNSVPPFCRNGALGRTDGRFWPLAGVIESVVREGGGGGGTRDGWSSRWSGDV